MTETDKRQGISVPTVETGPQNEAVIKVSGDGEQALFSSLAFALSHNSRREPVDPGARRGIDQVKKIFVALAKRNGQEISESFAFELGIGELVSTSFLRSQLDSATANLTHPSSYLPQAEEANRYHKDVLKRATYLLEQKANAVQRNS